MKKTLGSPASAVFEDLLKAIKPDPTHYCAIILHLQPGQEATWQKEPQKVKIVTELLEQALGAERSKVSFLLMPSGNIFTLLDHTTHTAYKAAHQCLDKVAKELMTHPGELTVSAFDLSVGWDAFFTLCKSEYRQSKQVAAPDHNAFLKHLDVVLKGGASRYRNRSHSATKKGLSLLFVEDDASTRQLLNSLLGEQDVILRFASNAEEAAHEYASHPPHIVFLDINLPDATGLEILEIIARYDPNAHAVMLTSSASSTGVEFARKHGVKGYIVKPFSLQKLQACLERYTSQQ